MRCIRGPCHSHWPNLAPVNRSIQECVTLKFTLDIRHFWRPPPCITEYDNRHLWLTSTQNELFYDITSLRQSKDKNTKIV